MSTFMVGVAGGAGRGQMNLAQALMERFVAHLTLLYQEN